MPSNKDRRIHQKYEETKRHLNSLGKQIDTAKLNARNLSSKLLFKGINDSSDKPSRVWLTRSHDDAPWIPLSKSDCFVLNKISDECNGRVLLEAGRATADLNKKIVEYNFCDNEASNRQLASAIWFEKERKGDNKGKLKPISKFDELVIEHVYQNGMKAILSGDKHLNPLLTVAVPLTDQYKHIVYITKVSGMFSMRKRLKTSLSSFLSLEGSTELFRGYDDYHVDGEEEEELLGPVKHLVFVIHGVGDAFFSRGFGNNHGVMNSMKEVDEVRNSVTKKLYDEWQIECKESTRKGSEIPSPPNRIEFIPIQWSDKIHSTSSNLKNTLNSSTLKSIPKLRVLANEIVFDVLMYLTPEFCEKVLAAVTQRISDYYERFLNVHQNFKKNNGTCSLIGHSLGSVIAWDILSILQDNASLETLESNSAIKDLSLLRLPIFHGSNPFENDTKENNGTWGPSLTKKMSTTIPFTPKFTLFLGSPLGMFLTLRGALPLFNNMRLASASIEEETLVEEYVSSSPFSLPGTIYNIFHSSDPVAYRIEPLLLPPDTKDADLPPPPFLISDKNGLRFHVKVKEIHNNLLNSFSGSLRKTFSKEESTKKKEYNFALGGDSARVDFQLQPGVVENEYLSALSAHNSYLTNDHVLEFIIQCANEARLNM